MSKAKSKKKKVLTESSWWLAEIQDMPGQYVADVQNNQAVLTTNLEEAQWAETKPPVVAYLRLNNLNNAKPKEVGGLHPGTKPPLL